MVHKIKLVCPNISKTKHLGIILFSLSLTLHSCTLPLQSIFTPELVSTVTYEQGYFQPAVQPWHTIMLTHTKQLSQFI